MMVDYHFIKSLRTSTEFAKKNPTTIKNNYQFGGIEGIKASSLARRRLRFLQKANETIKISGCSLRGKTQVRGGGIFLASRRLEFELRCSLIVWKEIVGIARGAVERGSEGRKEGFERFSKDFRLVWCFGASLLLSRFGSQSR